MPTSRSARVAFGLTEWVERLLVAMVFVIGMFATAGGARVEAESDISAEGGEDTEEAEQARVDVHATRRPSGAGGPGIAAIAHPAAPRASSPRRRAPPTPNWSRPRRSLPDDDDELLT